MDVNNVNNVNNNGEKTTILLTSKRKISLLLIVLGGLANLGEVLFTSHIEYYCSSKLQKIILSNNNGDDDDDGYINDYYNDAFYYSINNNQTMNSFQCINNYDQTIYSNCKCKSEYCTICNTCSNLCFKTTPQSSNQSSVQCFKEVSNTLIPTFTPTHGPKKKLSNLKAQCDPEVDFTKRPFIVVAIFAFMDCIKQYMLSKFQFSRTWKGRIIYLILHVIIELAEACILFVSATIFCYQTCPQGLPDYGGYKGIFGIYLAIASIQVAFGPLREYCIHFEESEIRLPAYLIARKLAMTLIGDLTVGIFSFNSHKVYATNWFRYLIFIYIWIVIAGIEMIIGIKEILFDSFKSKLQAIRCHVHYLYITYFSWGWFIWFLSFFTIPHIKSCISVNQQNRELFGNDCEYKNPYWLIILIWINAVFFSLYFRYTLIITNFIEERFRCSKGHKCKIINEEMLSNIIGIPIRELNQKCNHCDRNVPLYKGYCSVSLHKYVFEFCNKCNYFCCMNCAYKHRHSEYYLYGLLWRKPNSLPDIISDIEDDEEFICRPSKRISISNDIRSSSIISLQNDNRLSLNPLNTDVQDVTSRL